MARDISRQDAIDRITAIQRAVARRDSIAIERDSNESGVLLGDWLPARASQKPREPTA